MGSSTRFDDIETKIVIFFLIQVVVRVSFNSSVGTQIDSKQKSLLSSETGRLNTSSILDKFSRSSYTCFSVNVSHSIFASQEMLIIEVV